MIRYLRCHLLAQNVACDLLVPGSFVTPGATSRSYLIPQRQTTPLSGNDEEFGKASAEKKLLLLQPTPGLP